ncbi:MAG: beta-galactosidase, partial [Victivallales bacterium]|nr:beta-galactosidase [Victivallales bacterium]
TQYVVTAKLLVNGTEWDRVEQEVYVSKTREALQANKKGFITVKDGNFMLDGKPWYPVGVNYWTSNYAALEWRRYNQGFLVAGFYDTEQIEKDLSVMESVGINMLSVQLLGDTGQEDTLRNLIDFFHRCRAHNMYVNGFLKPASPFAFNDAKVEAAMKEGELAHFTELFAYDLCWEPGNYAFDAKARPNYDARWNKWLKERYGSVENAIKDWGIEPNRNEKGQIASPTDVQLRTDGDWRIYVAAYRRFMDDVTSQMWNVATRKMRALAPNQLMSFRQGNTLAHDFALTGPVKHMDFICPEGYSIPNNENGYNAAAFITRYVHFVSGGKPIIWAEFGKSIWDAQAVDISEAALKGCTDYHDLFYRMVIDSGANGTAPWWWSGWYRVGERSDFGIANPDGTPRPMATMLKKYAPIMKTERIYDEGDVPFVVDRDAHAGGYWYMAFNTGRDAYKAAREQKKQLKLISEATGKTSADVPLKAIGNVPCNGTNPPKYLNAEFNSVMLVLPNGTRIGVLNGAEITLPKNSPVVVDISIGN